MVRVGDVDCHRAIARSWLEAYTRTEITGGDDWKERQSATFVEERMAPPCLCDPPAQGLCG